MTLYNTSTYFSSYTASRLVLLFDHLPAQKAEDLGTSKKFAERTG